MPVSGDRTDFPHGILIAEPMEEVADSASRGFFESIDGIDLDKLAVPAGVSSSTEGNPLGSLKKPKSYGKTH